MIHVTNTNNQESQITIEPMTTTNEHQLQQQQQSATNCTFTTNDITQLTSLNATNSEVCLEGSSINLTTLNNGQLPENCLLASDGDICWNSILTDELRLVDTIDTYSNNVSLAAIPIANNNAVNQIVNNPQIDSHQSMIASNSINSITTSAVTNPIVCNQQTSADGQINQNLIFNTTTSNQATSYCTTSDANQFTNQTINQLHLNNSQVISATHNVVTCINPATANASVSNHQLAATSNWDANGNYMNLTYNQLSNQTNNVELNNGTSTINSTVLSDNHDTSPVIIQINTNENCLSSELNCNHFDNSNSISTTWIECTSLQNGKFETNAFDLDNYPNFSDLDNCSTY